MLKLLGKDVARMHSLRSRNLSIVSYGTLPLEMQFGNQRRLKVQEKKKSNSLVDVRVWHIPLILLSIAFLVVYLKIQISLLAVEAHFSIFLSTLLEYHHL